MNLVTLEGIAKQYCERQLLDGVDLRINEGDRIGLIGVNGSGKTTLLRIIAGLEQADRGKVTVWGGVRIEYLPQNPRLEGDTTVLEYVYAGGSPQLRLLKDYQEATRRLEALPVPFSCVPSPPRQRCMFWPGVFQDLKHWRSWGPS